MKFFIGYEKNDARKISLSITERPIQIIKNKFINFFTSLKKKEKQLNIAIIIKKNFHEYKSQDLIFENDNYFLDPDKFTNPTRLFDKLNFSDMWKNNSPKKIWTFEMSNKDILDKKSNEYSRPMIVEAKPKICGDKLIYVKQDGNIGAVNFKTGKRIWYNKYGNLDSTGWPRMRGFNCFFDKDLKIDVILLPTAVGVFCVNAHDGSLIRSRCKNGRLGAYETRVSAEFFNNKVYIATINPSGIQAYNFLNGKLLWHAELKGANPWNNFVIDKKKKLIFLNMGSPDNSHTIENSRKYENAGSLIALNAINGKIVWKFQEHSNDSWNHDFVGRPILSPKKINNKDIVIALSKSGSIYFLDRDNGMPMLPLKNKVINFGDFKYTYKKSVKPKPLLDTKYYNFIGKKCKNCDLNTKVFGFLPPILKYERYFDGSSGGPQWPGGLIDKENNLLILTSSHNIIFKQYADFVPNPPKLLPNNMLIKNCTSCHESKGGVKGFDEKNKIVPSLFLTTKIYSEESLRNYLKKNKSHKNLKFKNKDLLDAYNELNDYDDKIIKNKNFEYFSIAKTIDITSKDFNLENGPLGKITALSLHDGKQLWQIPAGTYITKDNKTIIGSKTFGAVSDGEYNDSVTFYTGSFDKKIYAINNKNGEYLWESKLPASGSALPLIYIDESKTERWIFVISTGGRIPNDNSDSIIAFKQKLK